MLKQRRIWLALLLVLAVFAASCGDDETANEPEPADDAESDEQPTADEDPEPAEEPEDEPEEEPEEEPEVTETLTIWADEKRAEPLQAVALGFTEATGVEVDVELVVFDELRDRVNQAAPAGEGPDIFVGAHDWTGELAANGVIASIDVSAQESSFASSALAAFNFAGDNYAVPYVTEAVAMYYNAGLVSEVPATFDDLLATCDSIGSANCLVLPGGGGATDAYHNYPFVSALGGNIFAFDPSTGFDASQVGLDSDATIAGVDFLATQVAAGTVPSTDYDTAKTLFLTGEAPFWITGPWELGGLRDQTDIDFGVALIPQIGDNPVQPFIGSQGFFLSAFSENSLIATSFLLDFVATDDTMQALFDADPRGTAWTPVQEALTSDPEIQTFAASAANGIPMPNIPQMGSVWGPLGDNLLLVRDGEATAADAMTAAAEAVRAAIAG